MVVIALTSTQSHSEKRNKKNTVPENYLKFRSALQLVRRGIILQHESNKQTIKAAIIIHVRLHPATSLENLFSLSLPESKEQHMYGKHMWKRKSICVS